MRRVGRVSIALPALVAAVGAGGFTAVAGVAAIDVAPPAGASFITDGALDATARSAFGLDGIDPTTVDESESFSCQVMDMTADPEADD
jgi:hypothetical protein